MELPTTCEGLFLASNNTFNTSSCWNITDYRFGGLAVLQLRYTFASFCGVILLIGLVGNLFMLLVLIEGFQSSSASSSICAMTSTLMVNITISDLIFLLYNVTVLLLTFVYEDWEMGSAVCISSQSFSMWTMFCSFYSMVATSILRYVAVVHPTCSFSTNTFQRSLLCMLMWLMGFTVSIPNWMHQGIVVIEDARIVQSLWFRRMAVVHPSARIRLNKKATVMILTVLVIFILMWIPCSVVIYLSATHTLPQSPAGFVASSLSTVLAYSNCSVSPLICFSLSDQFQGDLKKLLCQRGSR
ncbi:C-C chemokine receptor type 1-like [Elgaria multicarinata webbii]|uniref:C-C chemokine receptor type 1-like n=1 Tax=Elgaria multicarinata webbii TaxID=159646 RepID=UPI002FCD1AE0